jgi:hypothetical protein
LLPLLLLWLTVTTTRPWPRIGPRLQSNRARFFHWSRSRDATLAPRAVRDMGIAELAKVDEPMPTPTASPQPQPEHQTIPPADGSTSPLAM